MSISKTRPRIVSFRLSQEEYDSLINATETRGARSISEFTRSVACTNMRPNIPNVSSLERILRDIQDQIAGIHRALVTLSQLEHKDR